MAGKMIKPTEAELEILQVLWAEGSSSVRAVNEILSLRKEVGYTTTLKFMQIMLEKGLVKRNTETRSHIYTANVPETDMQGHLLNRFVQSTFRGSASKLVMQLLGSHEATQSELEEIKALIEKLEKEQDS